MFRDEFKRLRKLKGMTQSQIAIGLNVSQATIASWESGKRRPDFDFFPTIAEYFDVSVDELLGRRTAKRMRISSPTWISNTA